ncbi:c-type cytochrome [Maribacter chungangensis]|uniref:C-type cytochrome n=1 Tax=Maribacter chungangensis TaxID=1069117 RepID=A0ABW3B4E3_9FLAO
MRLISYLILVLLVCNCKGNGKAEQEVDKSVPERAALSKDSQIFLGNRLFSEKTCVTCHDINKEKVGPSIKKIMQVYTEQNGDIVAFLKGETKPIVDTKPRQVAIMQANIDGFLKNISDEELGAIATYMMHVDQLNPN